jgi:uncharacterized protein YjiS (DUF1127 family)
MGTIETIADPAGSGTVRRSVRPAVFDALSSFARRLHTIMARRQQRRDLRELTDDQLRDIGLTRTEARREAARPFWD